MLKSFLDLNPAQHGVMIIGKAAQHSPRSTWKRLKTILRADVEDEDIIVGPEATRKRFRKERVSVPRSTATQKTNTLKVRNEEKY